MQITRHSAHLLFFAALTVASFSLLGCSSSGSPNSTSSSSNAATHLYLTSYTQESLLGFTLPATGAPTPSVNIAEASGYSTAGVATDSSGQVYMTLTNASTSATSILVYPANPTSASTPTRTISVSDVPFLIAVDAAGSLYTTNRASTVNVYAATASGASTPVRTVQLPSAHDTITDLATDASNNLYVLYEDPSSFFDFVSVYPSTATSVTLPTRTFQVAPNNLASGLTVDASGNSYVTFSTNTTASQMQVFSSTATGTATPSNTLTLPTVPGASVIFATIPAIDAAGNLYIYYEAIVGGTGTYSILVYPDTATGTAAPTSSFSVPAGTHGIVAVH
jgi:hypothetical protein